MLKKLPNFNLAIFPFTKRPYILLFNLTQRCNLRCLYCFGQYYQDQKELSYAQIKKILVDFYRLGVRRLGLSGGEPLLHRHIDKVIKTAVALGYEVGINSNGLLVPDHLEALKLVSNLSISLDSPREEINDRNRGKGTYKKAISGIEAAYQAGIPLHLCCTLTEANLSKWREMVDLGKKYQALVQLSPLYPQFSQENKNHFSIDFAKRIKGVIKEIIEEKKKKGNNIFFSEKSYRVVYNWPDYQEDTFPNRKGDQPRCLAGEKIVFLDSSGQLFPCIRVSKLVAGQDCLKLGVARAYEKIIQPPCQSCRWICFVEYNYLLNFNCQAIKNFLVNRLASQGDSLRS